MREGEREGERNRRLLEFRDFTAEMKVLIDFKHKVEKIL